MTAYRIRSLMAASALAATSFVSCDSSGSFPAQAVPIPCPAESGKAVTLVVGARQNSPAPRLPDEIRGLVREAAKRGQKIQVIHVDGVPTVALTATFATKGRNSAIRDRDLQNFLSQTETFVDTLQPKKPEADVLAALTVAGQSTPDGGTIVLMDSGIPTAGPLSFRNSDMFSAAPSDVAGFLASQRLLPDLSGRSIVLVGVGDTADPQPALPENFHQQILGLWTTVAQKAHAGCVYPLKATPTRTSVTTSVPVTVVSLPPAPTFPTCGTTVLSDSSSVGFTVNTANFRDQKAAEATLRLLANTMTRHGQRVRLTGTTSSEGSESSNQSLSERRAAAVKAVLVRFGVAESRITAAGAGEHGPNRIRDTTKDGALIPSAAGHNRSVVVTLTCAG